MSIDEAIMKFKVYCEGEGDFDELDFKEFIFDTLVAQEIAKAINDYQTNDEQRHIASAVRLAKLDELKSLKRKCKRRDLPVDKGIYVACVFEAEIDERIADLKEELDND